MRSMGKWAAALALVLMMNLMIPARAGAAKLVAITFDDGPNKTWTPKVVEALDRRGVKGTFFMVGGWVGTKEELVQQMARSGHQIANHTWEHLDLRELSGEDVKSQVEKSREKLAEVTGQENFLVRTPFGVRTEAVRSRLNAPLILWSQDPAKGKQVSGEKMARSVISTIRDGDIILLHDSTEANLDAACRIIDALQPKGYDFVTVDELFRLRGVTPQNGQIYKSVPPQTDPQAYDEGRLKEHWAFSSICVMEETGIMTGDGNGWHPNRYLTRAAAAEILWRAAGCPAPASSSAFRDISREAWYAEAVDWAAETGVAKGTGRGLYSPSALVSRQQFYVMLDRLIQSEKTVRTEKCERCYEDSFRISSWASAAVKEIGAMGFSSANDREVFRPGDPATRAEAAELLAWYLTLA